MAFMTQSGPQYWLLEWARYQTAGGTCLSPATVYPDQHPSPVSAVSESKYISPSISRCNIQCCTSARCTSEGYWASLNNVDFMAINLKFRSATIDDADHLVALLDAASRRLVSWYWSTMSEPGQSYFEVGRNRIRTKMERTTYFAKWWIAELEGRIAGAWNGYSIAKPYDPGDISGLPDVYTPIIELEAVAEGTWYLQVASVYPEFRGKGIGTSILSKAEAIAHGSGANRMSLMVESANRDAHRLYRRFGFTDWDSRPFIPFPGSSDKGDWILMGKDVDPAG